MVATETKVGAWEKAQEPSEAFCIVRDADAKARMQREGVNIIIDPDALDNYMHPDALRKIHEVALREEEK
jgi:hypothetical protein